MLPWRVLSTLVTLARELLGESNMALYEAYHTHTPSAGSEDLILEFLTA
jgi:hypothetical protein